MFFIMAYILYKQLLSILTIWLFYTSMSHFHNIVQVLFNTDIEIPFTTAITLCLHKYVCSCKYWWESVLIVLWLSNTHINLIYLFKSLWFIFIGMTPRRPSLPQFTVYVFYSVHKVGITVKDFALHEISIEFEYHVLCVIRSRNLLPWNILWFRWKGTECVKESTTM